MTDIIFDWKSIIAVAVSIVTVYVGYKSAYDKFWFSDIDRLKKFDEDYNELSYYVCELYVAKISLFRGLSFEDVKFIMKYSPTKNDIINFRLSRKFLLVKNTLECNPKYDFILRKNLRFFKQIKTCIPFIIFLIVSLTYIFWKKFLPFTEGQSNIIFCLVFGITLYLEYVCLKNVLAISSAYQILKKISFYPKEKMKNI
ncbi:hypothetical protein [Neisseria sp. Ec49-e6-T10]|uniref:hypothetical protein n=1 Tax=Neisseria sp. Ec49-e6-T10 TaxID=3140744 RepID=UPI003EBFDC85